MLEVIGPAIPYLLAFLWMEGNIFGRNYSLLFFLIPKGIIILSVIPQKGPLNLLFWLTNILLVG